MSEENNNQNNKPFYNAGGLAIWKQEKDGEHFFSVSEGYKDEEKLRYTIPGRIGKNDIAEQDAIDLLTKGKVSRVAEGQFGPYNMHILNGGLTAPNEKGNQYLNASLCFERTRKEDGKMYGYVIDKTLVFSDYAATAKVSDKAGNPLSVERATSIAPEEALELLKGKSGILSKDEMVLIRDIINPEGKGTPTLKVKSRVAKAVVNDAVEKANAKLDGVAATDGVNANAVANNDDFDLGDVDFDSPDVDSPAVETPSVAAPRRGRGI